jgi:hypothetical protein
MTGEADTATRQSELPGFSGPASGLMTAAERKALLYLVNEQQKALKEAARLRRAEMLAEFERQLAREYAWDDDETWAEIVKFQGEQLAEANQKIRERSRKLGIPDQFRPVLSMGWHSRGENVSDRRRKELIRVAQAQAAVVEQAAITEIERYGVDLKMKILTSVMTSPEARNLLAQLPEMQRLMPALEVKAIEHKHDNLRPSEYNKLLRK